MSTIKKYYLELHNFLFLWFGQSLSTLGSMMSTFAITILIFQRTESVLVLSIASLLILLPRMIAGVFVGPLVDRTNKKTVILFSDIGKGICVLIMFLLLRQDALEIWHIYSLNTVIGVLASFKLLAGDVAVSIVVPKEHYVRTNGLQSFSYGIIQVAAPALAALLLAFFDIATVIAFDLITLVFASVSLIFFVKIPHVQQETKPRLGFRNYCQEMKQGLEVIQASKILMRLLLFMSFVNLISGITYFNIISPMILARSGNDATAMAVVNSSIGIGGMIGAALVMIIPSGISKIKIIFFTCAISFLLGDVVIALGNSLIWWAVGGIMSSAFIPAVIANVMYFWRTIIPVELQGRAFSIRYLIQSGPMPVGMLIGGILADYMFEPFMMRPPAFFNTILGSGSGYGMALMFLITGLMGAALCVAGFFNRSLRREEAEIG